MDKLSIELLTSIADAFATIKWTPQDLQELIEPRFGMMTGFPQLVEGARRLTTMGLGDLPPAGTSIG